ncbi:MAG: winged helix-turn-helix domain-containing protein [Xanthomonadales bacterium]|nr:winged helix-turn-helix domain-containing protein [Xanthomonadales bacterium]
MQSVSYRFGHYRIDPQARELQDGGCVLALSPKVFDCLVYLLENRDRAIGRDELIAAVWGRADVSDTLLGQTILKARRAVGDDGQEQHAIRTIPRFGYRWVGEVETQALADTLPADVATGRMRTEAPPAATPAIAPPSEDAAPAAAAEPPPGTQAVAPALGTRSSRRRAGRWRFAAALLLAFLAAAGGAWLWSVRPSPIAPLGNAGLAGAARAAPGDTTAVMPAAVSAHAEWSWLRLGLMDLVATRLRDSGLAVVPSDNVVALARGGNTEGVVAATGAHYLVEPTVSRAADDWRVVLALTGRDGSHRQVEASDADVVEATRVASERLLSLLGRAVPGRDLHSLTADEIFARAEAAMLTDDLDTARRLLDGAPAEVRQMPELALRLGQIEYRAGQLAKARQRLEALLPELAAEARPVLRGRVLNGLGAVAVRQDRFGDAQRAFSEAVQLLEQRNQPAAVGQAFTGLAVARAAQGDYDGAAADFARARVALELAGDALALARVDENEAIDAGKRGRFMQSLAAHQRAAAQFERFGALNELAATLGNMAGTQLALLQPAAALAATTRAVEVLDGLENAGTRLGVEMERVAALTATGQLGAARDLLGELAAPAAAASPFLAARHQYEQAVLEYAAGRFEAAGELAAAATKGYALPDYDRERARAWLLLTRALRAQGDEQGAGAEAARLRDWGGGDSVPPMPVYAVLAEAEHAWAGGRHPDAIAAYRRALALASRFEVPADTAEVVDSFGTRLIDSGELEQASAVVGLAARWATTDFACAVLQARYYRALGEEGAWRAALQRARALAGERSLPAGLLDEPLAATR